MILPQKAGRLQQEFAVCNVKLPASNFPTVLLLPDQDLWSPELGWLAEQCVDPTS